MDSRIIAFIFFFTTVNLLFSQDLECGSVPTDRDIQALKLLDVDRPNGRFADGETTLIAISAHIVRTSAGTGGLTVDELEDAIADVNSIYSLTNMNFFLFGDINYIDDDQYYNFNSSDESALTSANNVDNTINVYFFNSATSGENALCGYAYFPSSGRDHIMMVNGCTTNGSTFPHELGHYFSLYHSHGKTNTGTTDELVDGSNCSNAGDDICDTAADPNLSGKVDNTCTYTGTDTDANGDSYNPNPKNLMSYSRKECRDQFSQGQADRIVSAYQTYKTYLISQTYAALFDAESRAVCEGESVDFADGSVGAVSYSWTFEGGIPATSTEKNPTVTYDAAGTYDVSLVITEVGGETDTKTFTDYVSVKGNITSDLLEKSGSFEETDVVEEIINEDGGITFAKTTAVATQGTSSIFIDYLNYGAIGEVDYLMMAALNTSEKKDFVLTFDYAYAPYNATYFDGLSIVYRDPCGEWVTVWEKFGTELQTQNAQTTFFTPSSNEWKTEIVEITIPADLDITEFAFKGNNGYGNTLYLDNYSIRERANFSVDGFDVADASCYDAQDGSITVQMGVPEDFTYSVDNITYTQNNVFENLPRGNYNVTVKDADGGSVVNSVTVGSPAELVHNLSITDASCGSTGEVSVVIGGGSGSYTHSLDGGTTTSETAFSDLAAGTYELSSTDLESGCTTQTQFEIVDVEAAFEIDLDIDYPSCPDNSDGSISILNLDDSYQFAFEGGDFAGASDFSTLPVGTYEIVVLDGNGCEKTTSVSLDALNDYPAKPEIFESLDNLIVVASNNQVIQWYLDDEPIAGETGLSFQFSSGGTYTVGVSNGTCESISDPFVVLTVEEIEATLEVYPNPATDYLKIKLPLDLRKDVETVSILDLTGRPIETSIYSQSIDVVGLKSGIYLLELRGEDFVVSRRFLKQ